MKRSIILLTLMAGLGCGLVSCANQGSAPDASASTPAGVGTATQTGASNVGALGAGAGAGINPGN